MKVTPELLKELGFVRYLEEEQALWRFKKSYWNHGFSKDLFFREESLLKKDLKEFLDMLIYLAAKAGAEQEKQRVIGMLFP